MAEIIQLHEFQFERRRAELRRRAAGRRVDHQSLLRAIEILKDNLAATAAELRDAPAGRQDELLERVERIAAMVRYAMVMAGDVRPTSDTNEIVR